jgi:hypothetical protein
LLIDASRLRIVSSLTGRATPVSGSACTI